MLFNSPEFLFAFLPAFLLLYFVAPKAGKNGVLFIASLLFYFTTSGELTVILILSVFVNYYLALRIETLHGRIGHTYFITGLVVNLAPLGYYKYSRFFLSSLSDALTSVGLPINESWPNPLLPIGISFFTFQAISYIADVHMHRVKPTRRLIDFGMYHSCFPQWMAGPIVRDKEVGLGKKVILADDMGGVVDQKLVTVLAKLPPETRYFMFLFIEVWLPRFVPEPLLLRNPALVAAGGGAGPSASAAPSVTSCVKTIPLPAPRMLSCFGTT